MQKTPMYRSSRTALALMAVATSMPVTVTVATAGEGGSYSGLAQREMIRRQEAVIDADRLLLEGREAYAKADYETAVNKYRQALDRLPDAPSLADRRSEYTLHLSDASVALAQEYRKIGKYAEARALLDGVLAPNVDPNNAAARRELGYLDDPIRTNPALTYEHTKNVDAVRRGLYLAEGNYNLGKYDDAKREYESVLRKDAYNQAARRGLERLANAKSDYYRAAYDHTRAELLMEVDKAWELSIPADAPVFENGQGGPSLETQGVAYITEKLKRIVIPRIDFEDTTVEEAVDFLRMRSVELDNLELDPAKKGVNFIVRRPRPAASTPDVGTDPADPTAAPAPAAPDPSSLRIRELRVRNVPLQVALDYICQQAKLRVKIDDFSVSLVPQNEPGEDFFSRTFRVSPDFASNLEASGKGGGAGGGTAPDPFAPDAGAASSKIGVRRPIKDLLVANDIPFPEGTSAILAANGSLIVKNTPSNLESIEGLIEAMKTTSPKQVKITSKFVEISQENTDELGFDWLVSPFGLSANNMFGSGGTLGSGGFKGAADFVNNIGNTPNNTLPFIPASSTDPVRNIMTGGLRSGDNAISRNNIDAILNNPNRTAETSSAAPGIAALTGLFSDGQVQLLMRGLAQKKGIDLMTAPSVMAKTNQKAKIEIIREFIYPTEYEPPELPNSVGATGGTGGGIVGGLGGGSGMFPVTPATPTAFETRNTGVTLEIEPVIGENDFVIELQFVPEIVEFEGFINYGSPIQSPSSDILGNPVTVTITENRIEMPVFSTRRVTTSLTIYDGYTVAVGGLMREDVQNVEDKVPILGDIPYIGRLFQSKAENRIKSNLIVFVTAQIIDATGRPLRGADAPPTTIPTSTGGDLPPGVLAPISPN